MLCCAGLIGGLAVGQSLGGPWTYIAPAVGFGIGLVGDMKLMKRFHNMGNPQHSVFRSKNDADPARAMEADPSAAQRQLMHTGENIRSMPNAVSQSD